MEIGADPDGLSQLADELTGTASSVESSRRRLASGLAGVQWHGPDARAFRAEWGGHAAALQKAGAGLRRAADQLRRNATDQRRASDSDGTGPGDPLPVGVERWDGSLTGNVTVMAGAGASAVITDLPGPLSLVTVGTRAKAGVAASAGAGAEVHDEDTSVGVAGGAVASAGVGINASRGWYVNDNEAKSFARDRVSDIAVDGAARTLAGVDVTGIARSMLGLGPPPPDVTTATVGSVVSASGLLVAGLGGTASASGEQQWQAGTRDRGGEGSLLISVSGAGAASVPAALFGAAGDGPKAASGSANTEIEIFPVEGATRPVVVTSSTVVNGSLEEVRTTIVLDDVEVGRALHGAWESLGHGDVSGMLDHLGGIDAGVLSITTDSTTGRVGVDGLGASISGGEGLGVGLGLDGSHTVIDYDH